MLIHLCVYLYIYICIYVIIVVLIVMNNSDTNSCCSVAGRRACEDVADATSRLK